MNRRRAIAVLTLLGILDATYLLLGKLGITSGYACSVTQGCDVVNTSQYSVFLGIPVAAIGLAGYLALFVLAVAGTQSRWLADRRPDLLLSVLAGLAALFSLYLTYAELFILRAICQWCVVSQLLILAILVLALAGVTGKRGEDIEGGRAPNAEY
ncbi:MAG: vitamin K epoxide reductase family protein [Gemmatimonadota bacterium]|nr:MAG: vitamin K epoxide reductase family protein [Gemmatimonadota bacterium]